MTANTKIEWAHHTMNFWTGCQAISPGCAGCYAETWAKRAGRDFSERKRTTDENWRKPLKWDREAAASGATARVFTNSLADFFDNEAPVSWRAEALQLMHQTPHLTWLVLTKRIGNALKMIEEAVDWHFDYGDCNVAGWLTDWYKHGIAPANIWIGATVVNQAEADRDIPKLLAMPARIRFLSIEPMLGQITLPFGISSSWCPKCRAIVRDSLTVPHDGTHDPDFANQEFDPQSHCASVCDILHWVIVGGESGHNARSMVIGWAKEIVRQCAAAGVACFVKQLGSRPVNREGVPHPQIHAKGGDPREWPEVLRVRQFPEVA